MAVHFLTMGINTDVSMPGTMDGIRLAHYIRRRWPPVKLIVASGKAVVDESHLPAGARFFPKPYSDSTIVGAMMRMLADAGYPIEDATQEVKRIQARAFVAAVALADATADNDAVREYLGLPKANPEIPKVPMPTPAKPPMPSPANPPIPTPSSW